MIEDSVLNSLKVWNTINKMQYKFELHIPCQAADAKQAGDDNLIQQLTSNTSQDFRIIEVEIFPAELISLYHLSPL